MINLVEYIGDHLEDDELIYNLTDILEQLEPSKEAVDAILEAIISYDIKELYDTILDEEFRKYLTESQVSELEKKYQDTFDLSVE